MNNYSKAAGVALILWSSAYIGAMGEVLTLEKPVVKSEFVATRPELGGMAYLDTMPDANSDTPTIVFIHGNSMDKYCFKYQLSSSLLQDYRLISVDLPGHGESFRAQKPENVYNYDGYSDAVLELIKALGLTNYVLVGWSLGGCTAMDMYAKIKDSEEEESLRGLVLTGSPPAQRTPENLKIIFKDSTGADPEFMKVWTLVQMTPEQAKMFAGATGYDGTPETEFILDAVVNTDGRARLYLVQYIAQSQHDVDEKTLIEETDLPVLVVAGGADAGINNDYIINTVKYGNLWREEVFVLDGIGHGVPVEAPDQFNKLVSSFARDVFDN